MIPLNLRTLYETVNRILADPTAHFVIQLEVRHYGLSDDPTIAVGIWDGPAKVWYNAPTSAEALEAFKKAHGALSAGPLAAVEAVEVPDEH